MRPADDLPTLDDLRTRSMIIRAIGFDADDTLWHNENIFSLTHEKYRALLSAYAGPADVEPRLYATEMKNLRHFGYGIKGFTLSMIETAIELTGGRITAREIQTIIDFAHEMREQPVQLLEGAAETVRALAASRPLLLITKGDLFDQESKIAQSGLAEHFRHVEILSEKDEEAYRRVLVRHGIAAHQFLMVGNSFRSDILPVVALGGVGVHVPYHLTWAHEREGEERVADTPGVFRAERIDELPGILARLEAGG